MSDSILIYAVMTIAFVQTRTLLAMKKMGKAHTISTSWQFCLFVVVHSLSPWASDLCNNGHGYIYMIAQLLSEALLLAALLYTSSLKLWRMYCRLRGSSDN